MNEIMSFNNEEMSMRAYKDDDQNIMVSVEDVARGLNIGEMKNDKFYPKLNRVNKYLQEFGVSHLVAKEDYIPLDVFFLLVEKCKTANKQEFVRFVCDSFNIDNKVITSITRFEHSFGKQLEDTLSALDIEIETQKSMFGGKYRIDFYLPKYKIAIEYDEARHQYQQDEDRIRQEAIEKELGCTFVRLDYKDTDAYNVGLVIKNIMKAGD